MKRSKVIISFGIVILSFLIRLFALIGIKLLLKVQVVFGDFLDQADIVFFATFVNVIEPILRFIKGPRPLRPKYLKAFRELCPNPISGYWDMLKNKDVLIKPLETPHPVKIDASTLIYLITLHANGLYVADIDPENQRIKLRVRDDYLIARYGEPNTDLQVMIETYVEALYDGDYSGMSVIDIGGYIGETAIYFAQKGAKQIFCVEPAPDNLILLHHNISQSSFRDRILIIEAAIMSRDGVISFYTDKSHYFAFHVADCHEFMQGYLDNVILTDVEAISFSRLLEYTSLREVDLVKLDCEGAEYDILLNTPASILRRVRRYIVEYHNGSEPLVSKLKALGYKVSDRFRVGQIGLLYAELP